MGHVKFHGSGFIGFRNFAFCVVDFFLYGQDIFHKLLFPYFYIVIGVGIVFFVMTIISSEDSFPQSSVILNFQKYVTS